MIRKHVIIVGAGVGGITTAIYLARKGFDVTILEKNNFPGGRCGHFVEDGHRFDIGATLLMMPDTYKQIFSDIGRNLEDELDLIRMEPVYKLKFHDNNELIFTTDMVKMKDQLEDIEPGSFGRFLALMKESCRTYQLSMGNIIEKNYYSPFDFFNIRNMMILARVNAFKNHYRYACRYFKSDILRAAFTFQNIYVGQDPFKAPAVFAILPFQELTDGVWFPKGGMNRIVESLVAIALENGVKFEYGANVKQIKTKGNRIIGVITNEDSVREADIVIANADLPYVYNRLLPVDGLTKKINRMEYTCSAVVFHWAMDTSFPQLEQHTVFVSEEYQRGIQAIFNNNLAFDDPCFYVHSPAKSDPSAAPDGQESLSVIVPAPHLGIIDETSAAHLTDTIREAVINRMKKEGMSDFDKHIKFEKCFTQPTWENMLNLTHGAIFGSLSHRIFQMGYFRPHNQHRKYKNLFFTGGSTHPGNGVPMSLISAKLAAEKVIRFFS